MYQQRRSGLGRQDRGFRGSGGSYRDAGRGGMSRGGGNFGRFGGGGGGSGGFGRSPDDFGRSGRVNPWQSGMMPGMNDSSSRGGGLLPTPGGQSSNLLNQLSSPEAQLALAGNLLSTILKPQQQQQENQQVQQLLNLSALGQLGNRAAAGLASLAQAQMQVQSQSGRSSSWGSMGPATKRRRFDGLSGRRTEMGSKPTLGRDSFGSRDRRLQRGSFDQRPGTKGSRPPARRTIGSRSERRDDRRNEKEDRAKRDDKKENEDDKERDDENEESGEEKEKDENSGKDEDMDTDKETAPSSTPKKGDEKKRRDTADSRSPSGERKHKDDSQSTSRYAGIPATLLFCQVCEKKMWDDSSFENHIRGRNHHMMLDRLEESFTIRAQLMRQQVKLAEQKREILLDKLQRQGKKINMKNREYCTMCDLNFVGNILSHRKTATHQKLKTFLHPKCVLCSKEFTTRLDWEKHKLTAFHLKRVVEADETPDEKSEPDDLDDFDAMDLVTLDSVGNVDDEESQLEDMENAEEEAKAKDKPKVEGEEDEKKSETGAAGEKKAPATETLTTAERWSQLAASKYDPAKTYGVSMVRKVSGYFCRLCHKFFVQEQEALQTHCKTRSHFEKYVLFIKAKVKAAEQQKAKEEKEKKIKKAKVKAKHGSDEEEEDDDDDGNWKRRKVNKGDVEEEEEEKVKEQLGDEGQTKAEGGQETGEEDDGQKKSEETDKSKDEHDKMDVDVGTPKGAEEQKSHDKEDQDSSMTEDQDAKRLGPGGGEVWEGEEGISETQEENEGIIEGETGDHLEAEQLEINGDEKAVASDPLEEEAPCEDEEGDLDTLLEKVSGEIGMVKEVSETGKTKAAAAKRVSTGRGRGRKRK